MRRITFMILGLGLALAPAACAEDWSKIYTITGKPDLRVETSDADIHVDTWNQNTIEARSPLKAGRSVRGASRCWNTRLAIQSPLKFAFHTRPA